MLGSTNSCDMIDVASSRVLLLLGSLRSATDLARLRNGFTIRHERRTTVGETPAFSGKR